jgi:xylose dehydrogenase (NAD/NADP)
MVRECERAEVPLMVAYRMHFDPAVRRARELVESGFLGTPVSAHGRNTQSLLELIPDEGQWRLDPDLTGYGTSMMDLGIYAINTTRFLLRREPSTVQAQMSSHHEAFADVPDERATAVLTFDDGMTLTTTASQNAQEDTQLTITGTEGQVELRPAFHGKCSLHLSCGDASASVEYDESGVEFETAEMIDYFADRVLCEKPIHADGHHGLQDLRILRAIHHAAEREASVDL